MTREGAKAVEGRVRKGSYAAPALDKAFQIIELLADHPEGLLVSEMAVALGRSLGELFRIVVVMEEARYLEKSRLEIVESRNILGTILDILEIPLPAAKR